VIRSCIDYRDLFGRFETGEFILVLVDHTRESAMELLEHIRQKISVIPFSIGEEEVALSVSIGAVFHPEDTLNDTINEADSALVQAKASGGNTLYVA
jgi:diguanylate cyclase (GGDEF)-like protein